MKQNEGKTKVNIIDTDKESVLVQFVGADESLNRVVVQKGDIVDGYVSDEVLQESPDAGIDFESMGDLTVSPAQVQAALRSVGVFADGDFSGPKMNQAVNLLGILLMREVKKFVFNKGVKHE